MANNQDASRNRQAFAGLRGPATEVLREWVHRCIAQREGRYQHRRPSKRTTASRRKSCYEGKED